MLKNCKKNISFKMKIQKIKNSNIGQKTLKFIMAIFTKNDASHDVSHALRVANMSFKLAEYENVEDELLEVIYLASLLHDVGDYKYCKSEKVGEQKIIQFLKDEGYGNIKKVMDIISTVSFRKELSKNKKNLNIEQKIVQDADRLDSIGAIGIARCFIYTGAKMDTLHIPGQPPRINLNEKEYRKHKSTAINHFYEKLFKIKSLMKTKSGKRIAKKRHEVMKEYLDNFLKEWDALDL